MLGAYYTTGIDSQYIFNKLNIGKCDSYLEHLNKHNVISISFNKISDKGNSFKDYIEMIRISLMNLHF